MENEKIISNETREKNLINLKNAIDLGTIDEIIKPTKEWGGAYIIITSSEEKLLPSESDEMDFYSRREQDTYVLTKHSRELSGLFYYVKENVLGQRDNYLYGFMALLANDYIKQNDEPKDYVPFLEYIINKIYAYFLYYDWGSGMSNSDEAFDVMRYYLSENISDEEIKKIL